MLVKDIIKTTSSMLNRQDVLDYLNDKTQDAGQDTLPTINLLVNLLNAYATMPIDAVEF